MRPAPPATPRRRVVLFNVAYSENVGDGVIAECMAHALRAAGAEVDTIDLAGREGYGAGRSRGRAAILRVLHMLPAGARRSVVRARLASRVRAMEDDWTTRLAGADLAVIGGGNLFQDDGLNFPLKVAAAARACRRAGVAVRVHAVGASDGWSDEAQALFGALRETELAHVSVRDAGSARAWRAGGVSPHSRPHAPTIVRDPGLLARALLPPAEATGAAEAIATIGLGIAHPAVLAHHGAANGYSARVADFAALATAMIERGWRVRLFTNGAREDHAHARRVLGARALRAARRAGLVTLADRPRTATELVALIDGLDGVVAHRLHAVIVATALGRANLGLAWDRKVAGFYDSIDRPGDVAGRGDAPATIAERLARRLHPDEQGDRAALAQRLATEAGDAVRALLAPPPDQQRAPGSAPDAMPGRTAAATVRPAEPPILATAREQIA